MRVCVCACARARVCACMRACVYMSVYSIAYPIAFLPSQICVLVCCRKGVLGEIVNSCETGLSVDCALHVVQHGQQLRAIYGRLLALSDFQLPL